MLIFEWDLISIFNRLLYRILQVFLNGMRQDRNLIPRKGILPPYITLSLSAMSQTHVSLPSLASEACYASMIDAKITGNIAQIVRGFGQNIVLKSPVKYMQY